MGLVLMGICRSSLQAGGTFTASTSAFYNIKRGNMLAAVQKYKGFGVFWGLPIGSRMSSSIVWAVDARQDVLEFYRILWQALVARQEAFMLHLYSYICLQQLVPGLGFLEFHALVPRTIHVYQCKSAKHNKRILPCTTAKSA